MITNLSDILTAPWQTGILVTAIRLRIFSVIGDQKLELNDISSKCETIPERIEILLDACVSLGFLQYENNKYRNSQFSRVYFVEGKRQYVGDFITILNNESVQWYQLPELIRGKAPEEVKLPGLDTDYRTFINAMNCLGLLGEAEALRDMVDLSGCKTITDAGGGSGVYSLALCDKYPDLTSTILDVKGTLEITKEHIENHSAKNQIILQEGNFLEDPLGKDIDAVLLSDVTYSDSGSKILLQNAWDSLAPGGLLIIRGHYANPKGSGPLFGAMFAVKLMVDNPGEKFLTISILENNVKDIGFEDIKTAPLTNNSFIITCKKGS